MSDSDIADYAPIPGASPSISAAQPGASGPVDVPAASVREVPAAAATPEPVRYRYVARIVPAAYHIWEELTGERVTTAPIVGEHQAEDTVRTLNRINSPPR